MNGPDVRADTRDFQRLFAKTSHVDKRLQTALRRNIRKAAAKAADAVKTEVRTHQGRTHGKHPRHTGLRNRIAAGVQVKVMTGSRAGVSIVASSRALAADEKPLMRAWDRPGGWRHPVYGRKVWTVQHGRPYFRKPIEGQQAQIRAAVESAMAEAARSLEGR